MSSPIATGNGWAKVLMSGDRGDVTTNFPSCAPTDPKPVAWRNAGSTNLSMPAYRNMPPMKNRSGRRARYAGSGCATGGFGPRGDGRVCGTGAWGSAPGRGAAARARGGSTYRRRLMSLVRGRAPMARMRSATVRGDPSPQRGVYAGSTGSADRVMPGAHSRAPGRSALDAAEA